LLLDSWFSYFAMNKTWWWLAAFIIVGVILGVGILFLVTRPPRGDPIALLPAPTPAPITVYVSGNVNQAGLYALPPGSRVNDAIQAAGGYTADANAGVLNLAEILEDGEQIDVPGILYLDPTTSVSRSVNPSLELVDINTATLEQLDTLPEIGPITAQNIIDYRNANGLFTRIEDIQDVKGIGAVTFEKIKDLITVGTSP
jgi:competence protein ComEA